MPASEITDDDVLAAAGYHRDAVEKVIHFYYPLVCRVAFGVSGSLSLGTTIVGTVVGRSLHMLKNWSTAIEAKNWFFHHTLLECRRLDGRDGGDDPLFTRADDAPAYRAFIIALRKLPIQQREAFLLTHGEKLDPRQTAVAMDCSMTAAANHLAAAQNDLTAIAGDRYHPIITRMGIIYAALQPGEAAFIGDVSQRVGGFIRRRRWRKIINAVLLTVAAVLIGWIAWRLSKISEV